MIKVILNLISNVKPYDNLKLNPDDNVSLTFLPNDEEEALKPIIFKTKVTSF